MPPLVLLSYSNHSWLTSLTQLPDAVAGQNWRLACLQISQGPSPLNLEALPQTPKMPLAMTAINRLQALQPPARLRA